MSGHRARADSGPGGRPGCSMLPPPVRDSHSRHRTWLAHNRKGPTFRPGPPLLLAVS